MKQGLRGIARNTVASWVQYGVAVAFAVFLTPMIIHGVGTPTYGAWILVTQLVGYAGLLDLGVQPAIVRDVARARAARDEQRLWTVLSTGLGLQLAAGAASLLVVVICAPLVGRVFDLGGTSEPAARQALWIVGFSAVVAFPAGLFAAALRGCHRTDLAAAVGIASHVIRTVAIVIALTQGHGIVGLAAASLLANAGALLGAAALLRGQLGGWAIRSAAFSKVVLSELLRFGAYSFLGTAGWYLAYGADAILIAAVLTATDVAHFGLAVSVVTIFAGVTGSVAGSFLSLASESKALGDVEGLRQHYLDSIRFSLLVGLPMAVLLVVWGPELLSLWVGPAFGQPSGEILRLLIGAQAAVLLKGAGAMIAQGIGLHRQAALIPLLEGLTNVVLSYAFAQRWGVIGVGLGTLIPAVVAHAFVWPAVLGRALGVTGAHYWKEAVWPIAVAAVPATVGSLALAWFLGHDSQALSLVPAAAFVASFWLLAIFTGLSSNERRQLRMRVVH